MTNSKQRILALVFGGVGVVLLMIAAGTVATHLSPPAGWAATSGIVVDNVQTSEDTYQPILEYRVDDRSYRVQSAVSQSPARKLGSRVDVWYERANPAVAKVAGFGDRFLVGTILAMVGGPFVLVSLIARWAGSRSRRVEPHTWTPPAGRAAADLRGGAQRDEPSGTVPESVRTRDARERPLYERDGVDPVSDDGPPLVR